ncbi:MAG: 30S ribosomal protein S26e [Candidatus Anstonellaceae archaeon]
MGKKPRGRERLVRCDSCGRLIPKDKSVTIDSVTVYDTEFKGLTEEEKQNEVRTVIHGFKTYCISCGKHRRIFEKKKRQFQRRKENDILKDI